MTRFLSIAAMGAGLMLAVPVSANAAPLSPQAPGAETAIEKVHGYHRSCRYGHRHQRDGDRVSCGDTTIAIPPPAFTSTWAAIVTAITIDTTVVVIGTKL